MPGQPIMQVQSFMGAGLLGGWWRGASSTRAWGLPAPGPTNLYLPQVPPKARQYLPLANTHYMLNFSTRIKGIQCISWGQNKLNTWMVRRERIFPFMTLRRRGSQKGPRRNGADHGASQPLSWHKQKMVIFVWHTGVV